MAKPWSWRQWLRLPLRSALDIFPEPYKKDVQVMITVLSVDIENDPSVLSAIAASAAIAISSIPWKGPVGTVRVGKKDGTFFTNPLDSEMAFSDMDLVVSTTADSVLMIEAGAQEVDEEAILGGIEHAQKEAKKIIETIEDLAKEAGVEK